VDAGTFYDSHVVMIDTDNPTSIPQAKTPARKGRKRRMYLLFSFFG